MPVRIPQAESMTRRLPTQTDSLVTVRNGGAIGQAMQGLGETVGDVIDVHTKYQTSKANSALLIAQSELEGEDYRDVDYGEITGTYDQKFEEKKAAIAANITNPLAKREFEEKAALVYQRGLNRAQDISWKREVDTERGSVNAALEKIRDIGMTGDIDLAHENALDLINDATELGYYTEQEKTSLYNKWRNDVAVGRIESIDDPQDRLLAIEQDWAKKHLDPNQIAKIRRAAKKEDLGTKTTLTLDGYVSSGLDREAARAEARSIADPAERAAALDKVDTVYDRKHRAESAEQTRAYEAWAARIGEKVSVERQVETSVGVGTQIEERTFGYDDIDEDVLLSLTEAQRTNLKKLSKQIDAPPEHSNVEVLELLADAKQRNNKDDFNKIISERSSELDRADQEKYRIQSAEEDWGQDIDSGLTDVQAVVGAIASANITNKKVKDVLVGEIGRWRTRQIKLFGKEPDDAARERFIDHMLMDRKTEFFDGISDAKYYEISADERLREVVKDPKANKDIKEVAKFLVESRGVENPTSQQILDAYMRYRK